VGTGLLLLFTPISCSKGMMQKTVNQKDSKSFSLKIGD
jgi:hypothetical protein